MSEKYFLGYLDLAQRESRGAWQPSLLGRLTPTAATSLDGRRCFRATTAAGEESDSPVRKHLQSNRLPKAQNLRSVCTLVAGGTS